MSPADELRQAAAKVRQTAAGVEYGSPWAVADDVPDLVVSGELRPYGAPAVAKANFGSASWIALMSPALAEPLAAWLEGQGRRFNNEMGLDTPECPSCDTVPAHNHPVDFFHDGDQNHAGCDRPFTGHGDYRCTCFDDALAVARVINGGAS